MTLIVLFCYLKPQLFWIALRGMHVATREYGLHKWDIYKSWILVCIVSSHSSRQVYIHMHIRWDLVMYAMFVVLTNTMAEISISIEIKYFGSDCSILIEFSQFLDILWCIFFHKKQSFACVCSLKCEMRQTSTNVRSKAFKIVSR